jgi:hypothetical protein
VTHVDIQPRYYVVTTQGLLLIDIRGATWARICRAILCGINAIAQRVFLSAYPAWGMLVIALDVLVIWALIVHGDAARDWGQVSAPARAFARAGR